MKLDGRERFHLFQGQGREFFHLFFREMIASSEVITPKNVVPAKKLQISSPVVSPHLVSSSRDGEVVSLAGGGSIDEEDSEMPSFVRTSFHGEG